MALARQPDATSTFEAYVNARAFFLDLRYDELWNPWRMEDQAAGVIRAMRVMEKRAEPGFKRTTKRQLDAEWLVGTARRRAMGCGAKRSARPT